MRPKIIEHNGERRTLVEWCAWARATLGNELTPKQLDSRLKDGLSMPEALSRPIAPSDAWRRAQRAGVARAAGKRRAEREEAERLASAPLAPFLVDPSLLPKAPPRLASR
jgi:hypothetical protein